MTPPTVLYVAPEDSRRAATVDALATATEQLTVLARDSIAAATDVLLDRTVDCLVTEYQLPDGTAFELLEAAREITPDIGVILFTDADPAAITTDGRDDQLVEYVHRDAADAVEQLTTLIQATVEFHAQHPYPLRENEPDRLAAIEALDINRSGLDKPLDQLTELAARHFGVEVASINICKQTVQEVRTCYGADWPPGHRADSICTYTILDEEVTIIEDIADDPRFADNETLQTLAIRAYMGANILTQDGHPVATLCVYDDEPRSFSTADAEYLQLLAAVGGELIARHPQRGTPTLEESD